MSIIFFIFVKRIEQLSSLDMLWENKNRFPMNFIIHEFCYKNQIGIIKHSILQWNNNDNNQLWKKEKSEKQKIIWIANYFEFYLAHELPTFYMLIKRSGKNIYPYRRISISAMYPKSLLAGRNPFWIGIFVIIKTLLR